ncbi:MAG: glycerate kinase [Ignavibacterium sp.]|nr:glycerate kinase [Ignavibacterium sp.]
MKKILLAPNAFKECADSVEITRILSSELRKCINWEIIEKPLSDGGDGFLQVCEILFQGSRLTYLIKNIYDEQLIPIDVVYSKKNKSVYIESAEVLGLKRTPGEFRNPILLNSKGLGDLIHLIKSDISSGKIDVEKVIIGVGGTATVDFALGAASVFGLKLLDNDNNKLEVIPANYIKVKEIEYYKPTFPFELEIVADVKTPLFGKNNAIEMYSRQKGADSDQIKKLITAFTNIYNILLNNKLIKSDKRLNGAGGGLSAGLQILFDANIISSKDFIDKTLLSGIEKNNIDVVITGEGAFDEQSLQDKGANIIIKKFNEYDKPIFLICGTIEKSVADKLPPVVKVIEIVDFFNSKEDSIKYYVTGLQKAVKEIIIHLNF